MLLHKNNEFNGFIYTNLNYKIWLMELDFLLLKDAYTIFPERFSLTNAVFTHGVVFTIDDRLFMARLGMILSQRELNQGMQI